MAPRLLAVVGDPVAHSLSPVMHNAAIAALGFDARYVPLRTTRDAFSALVAGLLEEGGACNVTHPFKDAAFALGGRRHPAAERTRAVNCVWGEAAAPDLDNTDVEGIRAALRALIGDAPVPAVRIFGTGGSARAAACAVADGWPGAAVRIVSRTAERREAFLAWAEASGLHAMEAPPAWQSSGEVFVNATPLRDALPARDVDDCPDPEYTPPGPAWLLDLNYAPGGTPLVRFVRDVLRRPAADGRLVLVAQGAAAFTRFFDVPAPVEVMRDAVENALGS